MRRIVRTLLIGIAAAPCVLAGNGAGELTLDRAALAAVLSATLPYHETIELPGLGARRLTIDRVEDLAFRDGGVEARVVVHLDSPDVTGALEVRYEPRLERSTGVQRLASVRATPVAPLRLAVDLSPWLPPVDLARRFDWTLTPATTAGVDVSLFVQGLDVLDDRLRIELGVVARGSHGQP